MGCERGQLNCAIIAAICRDLNLEKSVHRNLNRLGEKYNGTQLWKEYRGTVFEGRVKSTVWNCYMGYRVKVIYLDGFEEHLSVPDLHHLLSGQKTDAV